MMSTAPTLFEYHTANPASSKDDLFLERLETFLEKSLSDIKAFAERESQPYEETRRYVAEWHAKYLFLPSTFSESFQSPKRAAHIQLALRDTSRILEELSTSSGVQSFVLAVDPYESSDSGFLGGSLVGREFWRGLRGGGETGARSFRTHCNSQLQRKVGQMDSSLNQTIQSSVPPVQKVYHAKSLKNELYERVRSALRSASGIRTAEMKWTNPERLDVYGVRLVGWPEGVPAQNPSSLKAGQNRLLLDSLQNGMMRFERLSSGSSALDTNEHKGEGEAGGGGDTIEDFSWAYDADAGPSSPILERRTAQTMTPTSSTLFNAHQTTLTLTSHDEPGGYQQEVWSLDDHDFGHEASLSTDFSWGDELHSNSLDVWSGEQLEMERPRKRPRSEEPPAEIASEY